MRTRTIISLTVPLVLIAQLLCAGAAGGGQFLVRAGDEWSGLKGKLKAGDEVILMPGQHRSARLEDLAGTEDQPIVIRSADPKSLSSISADDEVGLHLLRCRFVSVERLVVMGGRRAGVLIAGDTTTRSEGVRLTDVYVAKTGDVGEQCGIRIERTDRAFLKNCRVEAWHRAGVHVHASSDISLVSVQFVGSPTTLDQFGILVDGGSKGVVIERCRFATGVSTSIALGPQGTGPLPSIPTTTATSTSAPPATGGPDKPAPLPVLVDGVTVERCIAKRNTTFIEFGSCASILVRANTLVDSTYAYAVSEAPRGFGAVRTSTLIANLITWTPSVMKSFCDIKPGAHPEGLQLEANLWHSAELPMALPVLGEVRGTLRAKQITDIDPRLDGYDKPQAESAQGFGWTAP